MAKLAGEKLEVTPAGRVLYDGPDQDTIDACMASIDAAFYDDGTFHPEHLCAEAGDALHDTMTHGGGIAPEELHDIEAWMTQEHHCMDLYDAVHMVHDGDIHYEIDPAEFNAPTGVDAVVEVCRSHGTPGEAAPMSPDGTVDSDCMHQYNDMCAQKENSHLVDQGLCEDVANVMGNMEAMSSYQSDYSVPPEDFQDYAANDMYMAFNPNPDTGAIDEAKFTCMAGLSQNIPPEEARAIYADVTSGNENGEMMPTEIFATDPIDDMMAERHGNGNFNDKMDKAQADSMPGAALEDDLRRNHTHGIAHIQECTNTVMREDIAGNVRRALRKLSSKVPNRRALMAGTRKNHVAARRNLKEAQTSALKEINTYTKRRLQGNPTAYADGAYDSMDPYALNNEVFTGPGHGSGAHAFSSRDLECYMSGMQEIIPQIQHTVEQEYERSNSTYKAMNTTFSTHVATYGEAQAPNFTMPVTPAFERANQHDYMLNTTIQDAVTALNNSLIALRDAEDTARGIAYAGNPSAGDTNSYYHPEYTPATQTMTDDQCSAIADALMYMERDVQVAPIPETDKLCYHDFAGYSYGVDASHAAPGTPETDAMYDSWNGMVQDHGVQSDGDCVKASDMHGDAPVFTAGYNPSEVSMSLMDDRGMKPIGRRSRRLFIAKDSLVNWRKLNENYAGSEVVSTVRNDGSADLDGGYDPGNAMTRLEVGHEFAHPEDAVLLSTGCWPWEISRGGFQSQVKDAVDQGQKNQGNMKGNVIQNLGAAGQDPAKAANAMSDAELGKLGETLAREVDRKRGVCGEGEVCDPTQSPKSIDEDLYDHMFASMDQDGNGCVVAAMDESFDCMKFADLDSELTMMYDANMDGRPDDQAVHQVSFYDECVAQKREFQNMKKVEHFAHGVAEAAALTHAKTEARNRIRRKLEEAGEFHPHPALRRLLGKGVMPRRDMVLRSRKLHEAAYNSSVTYQSTPPPIRYDDYSSLEWEAELTEDEMEQIFEDYADDNGVESIDDMKQFCNTPDLPEEAVHGCMVFQHEYEMAVMEFEEQYMNMGGFGQPTELAAGLAAHFPEREVQQEIQDVIVEMAHEYDEHSEPYLKCAHMAELPAADANGHVGPYTASADVNHNGVHDDVELATCIQLFFPELMDFALNEGMDVQQGHMDPQEMIEDHVPHAGNSTLRHEIEDEMREVDPRCYDKCSMISMEEWMVEERIHDTDAMRTGAQNYAVAGKWGGNVNCWVELPDDCNHVNKPANYEAGKMQRVQTADGTDYCGFSSVDQEWGYGDWDDAQWDTAMDKWADYCYGATITGTPGDAAEEARNTLGKKIDWIWFTTNPGYSGAGTAGSATAYDTMYNWDGEENDASCSPQQCEDIHMYGSHDRMEQSYEDSYYYRRSRALKEMSAEVAEEKRRRLSETSNAAECFTVVNGGKYCEKGKPVMEAANPAVEEWQSRGIEYVVRALPRPKTGSKGRRLGARRSSRSRLGRALGASSGGKKRRMTMRGSKAARSKVRRVGRKLKGRGRK
jgi:hypothetical protein